MAAMRRVTAGTKRDDDDGWGREALRLGVRGSPREEDDRRKAQMDEAFGEL